MKQVVVTFKGTLENGRQAPLLWVVLEPWEAKQVDELTPELLDKIQEQAGQETYKQRIAEAKAKKDRASAVSFQNQVEDYVEIYSQYPEKEEEENPQPMTAKELQEQWEEFILRDPCEAPTLWDETPV